MPNNRKPHLDAVKVQCKESRLTRPVECGGVASSHPSFAICFLFVFQPTTILVRRTRRQTAARVRVAVFVRSEYSNALVGDSVPQPAPRSANLDDSGTALSVACSSLRQKPGEQLLCCSHTLHS